MILPHIAFGLYQPIHMAYESLELKNRIVCVPFQVQDHFTAEFIKSYSSTGRFTTLHKKE